MQLCQPKLKCPVCGRIYQIYSMLCGDKSMCPHCVKAAEQAMEQPDTPEQIERRKKYFGVNDCDKYRIIFETHLKWENT